MINDVLRNDSHERFTGMRLIENPEIPEKAPKIQLSDAVEVSPQFRQEYDAWLLERFGSNRVVCVIDGKMIVNPVNAAMLSKHKCP